jgi:peroxiredoxin
LWGFIAGAAVILVLTLALRKPRDGRSASGQKSLAPDFVVRTIDGQNLSLSEYRGKVVLLDFWATWCAPCRDEIPHFVRMQERYRDRGLQIIGISMDDTADPVRIFYRDFHMNYPVAMGGAKLGELYGGVLGLPIAFVIGRDGSIQAKHIGATPPAVLEKELLTLLDRNTL